MTTEARDQLRVSLLSVLSAGTFAEAARAGNPRQSPRRARAHAPARMSRSSPVAAPGGGAAAITAEALEPPAALSRAKALLEQAGSHEKKTQGIGREIKRIGRDTRRQQRQLSPEGPSGICQQFDFHWQIFWFSFGIFTPGW